MIEERKQKELFDRLYDAASKILRAADVNGCRFFDSDIERKNNIKLQRTVVGTTR